MPTILLTNHYSAAPMEIINHVIPSGWQLLTLEEATKANLVNKAPQADYFLASGRLLIDRQVLDAATKLKMIQRTGVGTDALDFQALRERDIPVYVNQGVNAVSVAEHAVMLMLSSLRKLPEVNRNVKNGIWKKQETGIRNHELNGKTIGLIGMGNIGRKVAFMLKPFGVKLLYFDVFRPEETIENELGLTYKPFLELLPEIDILSFHCALTPETKNMLGTKELAKMKRGAIIINTSRGGLIDEAALVKAMEDGHIGGAGLDVFQQEPISLSNPLLDLDNAIVTPHVGGVTYEAFHKMMADAVRNIVLFDEKKFELIEDKKLQLL